MTRSHNVAARVSPPEAGARHGMPPRPAGDEVRAGHATPSPMTTQESRERTPAGRPHHCRSCGLTLPAAAFSPSELDRPQPACRTCRRNPQPAPETAGERDERLTAELRGWALAAEGGLL